MKHNAKVPRSQTLQWQYRAEIALRFLAASVGGYVLAMLLATALAWLIPHLFLLSRAEGVLIGSLFSFLFYAVIAMGIFATRSMWPSWGLVLLAVVAITLQLTGMAG